MDDKKINLRKWCLLIWAVYIVCAVYFLCIAQYQINYASDEEYTVASSADINLGVLSDGDVVTQDVINYHQYLTGAEIYFATYDTVPSGSAVLEVLYDDQVLAQTNIDLSDLSDNSWYTADFDDMVDLGGMIGEYVTFRLTFTLDEGTYVTMGVGNTLYTEDLVQLNGSDAGGQLCITLLQTNDSAYAGIYPVALLLLFFVLAGVSIWTIWADEHDKSTPILTFIYTIKKYKFLMQQLVSRDFKTKYKRSVLGVFWSFLNPLLTMSVQYIVFSRLMRFQVENYPVYLLTGIVFFNGFTDCTTQAMMSIVGNAALITKVYVPKYIYPISKVLSASINIAFSMIPLLLVALFTGLWPTPAIFIVLYGFACFLLFMIGVSFALSAAMTFFRDMQFLWGVFTMMWMYATPVIYPLETLAGTFLYPLQKVNPMYHFISFFRTIIISGTSPEPTEYILCAAFAFAALLVGGLIFRKTQDKFVLYI